MHDGQGTVGGVTSGERRHIGVQTSDTAAAGDAVAALVRVVVAEDDVLLRAGLASLLERSGFVFVGRGGDGGQLLGLVREMKPELVLTTFGCRRPTTPRGSTWRG